MLVCSIGFLMFCISSDVFVIILMGYKGVKIKEKYFESEVYFKFK